MLFWSMSFEAARLFDATVAAKLVLMTTDMGSSLILVCDVRVAFGSGRKGPGAGRLRF
jgi:hypothetical protein